MKPFSNTWLARSKNIRISSRIQNMHIEEFLPTIADLMTNFWMILGGRRCWMDDSAAYLNYLENINKKSLLLIFSFNNLFVIRVIFFSIKIWLEGRGREEFLDDEQWMIRHDSARYFYCVENIHEKWLGVIFLKHKLGFTA